MTRKSIRTTQTCNKTSLAKYKPDSMFSFGNSKKDSDHQSVINLKKFNYHFPTTHLKMESLFLLKKVL